MKYVAHSFIGKRPNNEDCCSFIRLHAPDGMMLSPIDLMVLSDGMGGLAHGERVSREAVLSVQSTIFNYYCRSSVIPEDAETPSESGDSLDDILVTTAKQVNEEVSALIHSQGWDQAGATIVVCLVQDNNMRYYHLGDSRLYHWQAESGRLVRLTTDHTVPQVLYERGLIPKEKIDRHPLNNQLMFYIGTSELPEISVRHISLSMGDILLLCSDGISGSLSDETMVSLFIKNRLSQIGEHLLTAAMDAQSTDNMTLILYQYDDSPVLERVEVDMTAAEKSYQSDTLSGEESSSLFIGSNILDSPVWEDDSTGPESETPDDDEDTFMDTMQF